MGYSCETCADLLTGKQPAASTGKRARRNNHLSDSAAQRIASSIQLRLHSTCGDPGTDEFLAIADGKKRENIVLCATHAIHIGQKMKLIRLKTSGACNRHLIRIDVEHMALAITRNAGHHRQITILTEQCEQF